MGDLKPWACLLVLPPLPPAAMTLLTSPPPSSGLLLSFYSSTGAILKPDAFGINGLFQSRFPPSATIVVLALRTRSAPEEPKMIG